MSLETVDLRTRVTGALDGLSALDTDAHVAVRWLREVGHLRQADYVAAQLEFGIGTVYDDVLPSVLQYEPGLHHPYFRTVAADVVEEAADFARIGRPFHHLPEMNISRALRVLPSLGAMYADHEAHRLLIQRLSLRLPIASSLYEASGQCFSRAVLPRGSMAAEVAGWTNHYLGLVVQNVLTESTDSFDGVWNRLNAAHLAGGEFLLGRYELRFSPHDHFVGQAKKVISASRTMAQGEGPLIRLCRELKISEVLRRAPELEGRIFNAALEQRAKTFWFAQKAGAMVAAHQTLMHTNVPLALLSGLALVGLGFWALQKSAPRENPTELA